MKYDDSDWAAYVVVCIIAGSVMGLGIVTFLHFVEGWW